MPGIGIIANPHSKLNKRDPRRYKILSYIAGEQGNLKTTNNFNELEDAAREFYQKNISILAISGGDGTISRTLSVFIKIYGQKKLPQIAILGGGTINVLAKNLGQQNTPEKNLYKLIEKFSSGEKIKYTMKNCLQVDKVNYGFLFANGTTANFLNEYYKNKNNALGALMLILRLGVSSLYSSPWSDKVLTRENYTINYYKK